MILSPHEIAWLVVARWPKLEHRTAVAVCLAETGGDFDAMHRSADSSSSSFGQWDHGGWQISGRWNPELLQANPDWRDPQTNANMALSIWQSKGWTAWSVFKSKSFEKWLPDADWGLKAPFPPVPALRVGQLGVVIDSAATVGQRLTELNDTVGEVRAHFK